MKWFGRLGGLALATLFALGGCDGSGGAPPASSSTEKATVKGKVTVKGKPLAKADVRFNAANINRKTGAIASTTTGDDGSYEVTTLVGENAVTLGGAAPAKDAKLMYFSKTIDVKAGDNPFDIDIP
jgi:hypothetical protein